MLVLPIVEFDTGHGTGYVDEEDSYLLHQHTWSCSHNGQGSGYYLMSYIDGKCIYLHRLILGIDSSNLLVDHRDRNSLNNSKDNLRVCTKQQNAFNRTKGSNNTSGYKGVSPWKSKWKAQIHLNGKQIYLGIFPTPDLAYKAYLNSSKEYHKDFACG